jgi:hypothetical protein
MLKSVAEHLTHLQRLTFWGCTRVTRRGVYEVLHEASSLQELSIDALPHSVSASLLFLITITPGVEHHQLTHRA